MNCPNCHHRKSRIVDTRSRRRRHECLNCRTRWSTVEQIIPGTTAIKKILQPKHSSSSQSWLEKIQAKLAEA
jgi:transcriptional regulator NrdR family protein